MDKVQNSAGKKLPFSCLPLTASLLLLLMGGCGPAASPDRAQDLEAAITPLAEFPAPAGILRVSSAVPEKRIQAGSDYLPELLQNVSSDGSGALYTVSPAGDPPLAAELAYALYSFKLDSETQVPKLSLKWDNSLQPLTGAVYVAMADWQQNRWQWRQVDPGASFDIIDIADYRRADGSVLALVLLAQAGSGRLEWIRLGGNTPPEILVTSSGDGLIAPQTIAVDATASRDLDGSIAGFSWDWNNDGSIEAQGVLPGSGEQYSYLGGKRSLLLSAVDDEGLGSELLLEFEVLPHSPWWCDGANRYQNRRSDATGPAAMSEDALPAWSFDAIDGPDGVLLGPDGTIYCGSHTGKVYAINPADGLEITNFDEGSGIFMRLRAIGPDGSVYVFIDNGSPAVSNVVLSLDSDLSEIWRITAADGARDIHGFTLEGGLLVSFADKQLRSIDPDTQAVNWGVTLDDEPVGLAAVGDDGCVYISGNTSFSYGIWPNGELRSEYWTRDQLQSAPIVNSLGNLLCIGEKNYVTSFTPDGEELYKETYAGGNGRQSAGCIGFFLDDERLIFGAEAYKLHNLKQDGSHGWTIPESDSWPMGPIVDASENIYYSVAKRLVSVKPNKTSRWDFTYDDTGTNSIRLLGMLADGSLLVLATTDYTFHCYRP